VSCDSSKHGQARQLEERRRMSLPGVSTDPESDGAVGVDHAWKRTLERAMKETPLAASLIEAIQGMRDPDGKMDVDLLEDIVKGKREERVDFSTIQGVGGLDLQPGSGLQLARVVQAGFCDCDLCAHAE
jgi:hypothetical protein